MYWLFENQENKAIQAIYKDLSAQNERILGLILGEDEVDDEEEIKEGDIEEEFTSLRLEDIRDLIIK